MNLADTAEEIAAKTDKNIDADDVIELVADFQDEFGLSEEQALRTAAGSDHFDVSLGGDSGGNGGNEEAQIADIEEEEEWLAVEVKVVELWEPKSNSVAQVGLIGDESGSVKFTSWETSDVPTLEEGKSYRLDGVVTDEYEGRFNVKLNSATAVESLSRDVEVGEETEAVEGAIVALQNGSGLIKRCPANNCSRTLRDGRCSEHGKVDGTFDLRLKAIVDNGDGYSQVLFNQEETEAITGISMQEAKQTAMDEMDTEVVGDIMANEIIGSYVHAEGSVASQYVLAEEHEIVSADESETPSKGSLVDRAKQLKA